MGTLETWVMVLWLVTLSHSGAALTPKATPISYPTQIACERGHERANSSLTTLVVGRSKCVRVVGVRDPK